MNMGRYTFSSLLESPITNIRDLNSSFALGTLRVAYTGNNPNGTNFTHESFEASAPSMFNCPIVANYDAAENTIGGHDMGVVETESGEKIINITEPVGVIPESATYRWETLVDDNVPHEYFCIDNVILWKRQPCYEKIAEDGVTAQSFEIKIRKGDIEDDILNINEFEFEAFCLLERDEPCFQQAALQVFSKEDSFKSQVKEMLEEYANLTGGVKVQENVQATVQEENIDVAETVVASVDVTDSTNVEPGISTNVAASEDGIIVEDNIEEDAPEETPQTIIYTANEIRNMLFAALMNKDVDGYVCDFTFDTCFVGTWDDKYFAYKYQIVDGNAVIDFDNGQEMRLTFVPKQDIADEDYHFSLIEVVANKAKESAETEYSSKINDLNQQVETLSKFRNDTLAAQRASAEEALFSKFDNSLKHSDEYKKLKEESANYSIEELETQCFALLGKQNFSVKTNSTIRVPIDVPNDNEAEAYGGLLRNMKQL